MPITEKEMTYEEMKAVIANPQNKCQDCGGGLSIAWGGSHGYDTHILRCLTDITHAGYAREKKEIMYPGSHVGGIPRKEYGALEEKHGQEATRALAVHSTKTALTRRDATEIVETLWPGAPEIEKTKAIALCVNYQLNPLMRHVYLVGYNKYNDKREVIGQEWSIQVGIQANRLIASRNKDRPFGYAHDTPRLMTDEEELRYYKKADATKVRAITVLVDREHLEARGIGQINRDASIKGQEKGNSHENMACIRSERAALDRMCPGEMPQNVEIIDAEYEVLPDADPETGEIQEAAPTRDEAAKGTPSDVNEAVAVERNPEDDLDGEAPILQEPDGTKADNPERQVTPDEIAGLRALLLSIYVDKDLPEEEQEKDRKSAQRRLGVWCKKQGWDLASRNEKVVANLADLKYGELLKVTDAVGAKKI